MNGATTHMHRPKESLPECVDIDVYVEYACMYFKGQGQSIAIRETL